MVLAENFKCNCRAITLGKTLFFEPAGSFDD